MNFFNIFSLANLIIEGGKQASEAVSGTVSEAATGAVQQSGGFGIGSVGGMILYVGGLIALFYFFAIRPQKKKEKELQTMQSSIKVGDWIVTSSGFYGKVVDVSDQVFVVEFGLNKGVRIPVRKSEIIGNKEPDLKGKSS